MEQVAAKDSLDYRPLRQQIEESLLNFLHLRIDAEVCRSQFRFEDAIRGAQMSILYDFNGGTIERIGQERAPLPCLRG